MKNILFPTDFSDNARNALMYACDFALKAGATLTIVHACDVPAGAAGTLKSIKHIMLEDAERDLEETMKLVKDFPGGQHLECKTLIRMGHDLSVVTGFCDEYSTDLIIMGTKGSSDIENQLIGSFTLSVIKNVRCPVIAIPHSFVSFKDPHRIVFAADYRHNASLSVLNPMLALARKFGSELHVLNVDAGGTSIHDQEKAELKNQFGSIPCQFFTEEYEDIVEGITHFIDTDNPDLLVMIIRKYNLFEALFHNSITKQLSFQSRIPVMILHE
jgi:nucleotide-binding universal stress UspA family protein